MAHKLISVILWTLVSVNLVALVFGGLITWLAYAIPVRLRQFGLAPELIQLAGLASLLIACLGLCALNYSSHYALAAYGLSCAIFIMFLLFGIIPDDWQQSIDGQRESSLQQQLLHANYTSTLSGSALKSPSLSSTGGLLAELLYFLILIVLALLLLFALILAYHLRRLDMGERGEGQRQDGRPSGQAQVSAHEQQPAQVQAGRQPSCACNAALVSTIEASMLQPISWRQLLASEPPASPQNEPPDLDDEREHSRAPLVNGGIYSYGAPKADSHGEEEEVVAQAPVERRFCRHGLERRTWRQARQARQREPEAARCRCNPAPLLHGSQLGGAPGATKWRPDSLPLAGGHQLSQASPYCHTMPGKLELARSGVYWPPRAAPVGAKRSKPSGGSVLAMTAAAAAALLGGATDAGLFEHQQATDFGLAESNLDDSADLLGAPELEGAPMGLAGGGLVPQEAGRAGPALQMGVLELGAMLSLGKRRC